MRVLVVHNRYSSRVPSGENQTVDDDVQWLVEAGIDVDRFEVSNDDVVRAGAAGKLAAGLHTVWSPKAATRLRRQIAAARPDVVNVHNVFPLLSPSVLRAVHAADVPTVWSVHNYRLGCVAGTHFRDGRVCHDCTNGVPRLAGIHNRCYAQSRAASAALTPAVVAFRSLARRHTRGVAVSQFVRDWLIGQGFDADRVVVNHGAVADPGVAAPLPSSSKRLVFVGRLAPEKGIALLLDAFAAVADPGAELHVIGSGELEGLVTATARADRRVTAHGQADRDGVVAAMASARAVVIPSLWDEPFGRTAIEAFSLGRPAITSGRGGLAEIVDADRGWIGGTEVESLAGVLREALAAPADRIDAMGRAARARYESQFTPQIKTRNLIAIYRDALAL